MNSEGEFEVISLKNGQRAIRHKENGEVMHPAVGPWAEANRLYVEQTKLAEKLRTPNLRPLRVLDVGLGGAANACAALQCAADTAQPRRTLELVSLETHVEPLRLALNEPEGFPFLAPWKSACQALISEGEWAGEGIFWKLHLNDALESMKNLEGGFDLIFFDPFSPTENPTMWTVEALSAVRRLCREDAILATYSAATPTRVTLLLADFYVGTGCDMGFKSQTTVASPSKASLEKPLDARWLERWQRSSARAPHGRALQPEDEVRILQHPQFKP